MINSEPCSVTQTINNPNWISTTKQEYDILTHNTTWDLVCLPPDRKAIGCKCFFRIKENTDGIVNEYKTRLVAKEFNQVHGFDFHEIFSLVKPITINIILIVPLTNGWDLFHLDINNAFVNDTLEETVYMVQPLRFVASDKSLFFKLNEAIYGLQRAPRQWFEKLNITLLQLGLILPYLPISMTLKLFIHWYMLMISL